MTDRVIVMPSFFLHPNQQYLAYLESDHRKWGVGPTRRHAEFCLRLVHRLTSGPTLQQISRMEPVWEEIS